MNCKNKPITFIFGRLVTNGKKLFEVSDPDRSLLQPISSFSDSCGIFNQPIIPTFHCQGHAMIFDQSWLLFSFLVIIIVVVVVCSKRHQRWLY